jgi:hypothetical protein
MTFEQRPFNFEIDRSLGGTSIALIGATKCGKTTLMKYLKRHCFRRDITVMFSMNSHADIYKDFDRDVLISSLYHPELIKEAHQINKICDNKFPFLFICDDYVDHKIKNDPEIIRLLSLYRNANMSSIQCFQRTTMMSATGRNNTNFIFIFKQNTASNWEDVVKEFLSMYLPSSMTLREMVDFCKSATEDHRFFVVDTVNGDCYLSKLSMEQVRLSGE